MVVRFEKPLKEVTEKVFGAGTVVMELDFMPDYFDARFLDQGSANVPGTAECELVRNSESSYTLTVTYDVPKKPKLLRVTAADLYIDPEHTINN